MPAKIARLATRPPFWIPEVSVAVRSSRLSCSKAEKTRIFMADRQSSGESRLNPMTASRIRRIARQPPSETLVEANALTARCALQLVGSPQTSCDHVCQASRMNEADGEFRTRRKRSCDDMRGFLCSQGWWPFCCSDLPPPVTRNSWSSATTTSWNGTMPASRFSANLAKTKSSSSMSSPIFSHSPVLESAFSSLCRSPQP